MERRIRAPAPSPCSRARNTLLIAREVAMVPNFDGVEIGVLCKKVP
jgi:hypothetical protein